MRAWMLLCFVPVIICSCGRSAPNEEEKITIKVDNSSVGESAKPADKVVDNPGNEHPSVPVADKRQKLSLADFTRVQRVFRDKEPEIRDMLKNDDRVRELVQKRNVLGLSMHLDFHYKKELSKLAEQAEITDFKAVGLMLARHMVTKASSADGGHVRPDRRGTHKKPIN